MGNPSYRMIDDQGEHVIIREVFDLTDQKCPGILMCGGKRLEGIPSAYRDITMPKLQAVELGFI
jgi:hypothetical protein